VAFYVGWLKITSCCRGTRFAVQFSTFIHSLVTSFNLTLYNISGPKVAAPSSHKILAGCQMWLVWQKLWFSRSWSIIPILYVTLSVAVWYASVIMVYLCMPWKYRGWAVVVSLILNPCTRWKWVVSFIPKITLFLKKGPMIPVE
jgi:hypothetical protein